MLARCGFRSRGRPPTRPLLAGLLALAGLTLPATAHGALDSAGAIAALNAQRAANGLPAGIVENASWSADCAAHTDYLKLNGGTLSHEEVAGRPGYTENGAWAGSNSVLSSGPDWFDGGLNPFESAPIHLMQLLAPQLAVAGAATSTGPYGVIGCMTTWPGYTRPNPATPVLLSYPGNGRTDVPAVEVADEMPFVPGDFVGLPDGAESGPYLYALAWGTGRGQLVSASLTGPDGPVAIRTVDNTTSTDRGNLGSYLPPGGMLIPVAPLTARATYTATAVFRAAQALPADQGSGAPSGPEVTLTRTWRFSTVGQPANVSIELDRHGVGVDSESSDDLGAGSENPAPITVTIVRLPSGTQVLSRQLTAGQHVAHHLPGGHYRACAHQDPHAQFDGYDGCDEATFRTTPRLTLKTAKRRHGKVRLTIGNDSLLAGAKASVTLRGYKLVCSGYYGCGLSRTGKPVRRRVRLERHAIRPVLRLPGRGRRIEVTVRAKPRARSELLLRAAVKTKMIRR